jgi:hypothetical protein
MKSHIVSRLYQATDRSRERCSKAPPEAAKQFEVAVSAFTYRHADLMKLVRESAYYTTARSRFGVGKMDPTRDTPETVARECEAMARMLRGFNDTPEGEQALREYEAILSK